MNMPRKNNQRSHKNSRRDPTGALQQTLKSGFKELLEASTAQELRFRPETPDIPRTRFSTKMLFNFELSYFNNITTSTTIATSGGLAFQASNVGNFTSYANIFDLYRIIQVNVKFIPTQTTATSGSAGTGGILYTVLDYDDANTPTNLSTMLEYETLKVCPPGQIEERTLTPRIAAAVYSGAFTSYASTSAKTWIDTASGSVLYYGVKYYIPSTVTVQTITYVETYSVQFKNQKQS